MLESKRRAIIFLTLSLILAATAGFLFLKKIKDLNSQLGEMVDIYVASTDIASRALIQPDQIKTMQIPKKYADHSYVTDKGSLKNQVTVVPLSEGEIITKNIIKPAATVRDQNNRLVTVYASGNIVFDQQVEALDRVDVIVSHEVNGKPATEVFMKDVPVAMVAKTDNQFKGVALEMPFEQVPAFIHQQHYAQVMRILKANVGKGELGIPEPFKEQKQQAPATQAPKPTNPPAQPPAAGQGTLPKPAAAQPTPAIKTGG
ncbi:flagella basal body P-ring formation protein FlgA [Brevibacillus choshinensis]|uniref:flagella basal body P-ring formation protein FlgA n=1 Tax=Brevibacillus choshinensis TaxID=54911 RepID=UPI002E21D7BA|nr:flagella basal body P-ring formation protein FlgA [Brevibacillus choshinensis]MED4785116.1 flagella basal body P-ring formation protein FlgA [Brevibacillus choshinensis]